MYAARYGDFKAIIARPAGPMPSIVGSIPDAEVGPIAIYLRSARESGVRKLDYNELIMCLLLSALGVEA